MKKLQFKINISAPVNIVYDVMLGISNKSTYEQWTELFNPTSTYEGNWEKGSKILFIGVDEKGEKGGMVSKIVENIPNQFISIQHYGLVKEGKEITEGTEVQEWANGLENYTFEEINGTTTVTVDLDTPEHYLDYMNQTYPKALERLKQICEKKITIKSLIKANKQKVWKYYTEPEYITKWNFALDTWHCPTASNDMRVGGKYVARMEAKDGSFGFDFEATYNEIVAGEKFTYTMPDGRVVTVIFKELGDNTEVTITFDAENENPMEMQKQGWQAILDNFKKYTEQN